MTRGNDLAVNFPHTCARYVVPHEGEPGAVSRENPGSLPRVVLATPAHTGSCDKHAHFNPSSRFLTAQGQSGEILITPMDVGITDPDTKVGL